MKRKKKQPDKRQMPAKDNMFDEMRQLLYPAEFRIRLPEDGVARKPSPAVKRQPKPTGNQQEQARRATAQAEKPIQSPPGVPLELVAELATCLWYLKTKHFKRTWEDGETGDDDPRVRRTLGRLNKGIERLREAGVEVNDPTNKRYPQGGEALMRPIEFLPTAGLTIDMVNETVVPIIFFKEHLIQRAEVFVAVPKEEAVHTTVPSTQSEANDAPKDLAEPVPAATPDSPVADSQQPAEAPGLDPASRAEEPSGESEKNTESAIQPELSDAAATTASCTESVTKTPLI